MKHSGICAILLLMCMSCSSKAATDELNAAVRTDAGPVFEYAICTFDGTSLPYRYARTGGNDSGQQAVVLILHGGPLKGGDNELQLEEPATKIITEYMSANGVNAIILAPQCPDRNSQGRLANWTQYAELLQSLVLRYKTDDGISAYIFGASIGGVGTWNMLSVCPGLFDGAMPCAANPDGCDESAVALCRTYGVMGSADTWAKLDVEVYGAFFDAVTAKGGNCRYDILDGLDHEAVCRECFTPARLDWVFSRSDI